MSIGRGSPGVRSNLRRFVDLVEDSAGERIPYLDYALGYELDNSSFAPDQTGTFAISISLVYDGVLRDVLSVETSEGIGNQVGVLTRVETLAECRATENTFYYEIQDAQDYLTGPELWDDGVSIWDDGVSRWRAQTELYVHLRGGADPRSGDVTCVAMLLFHASTRGDVQPWLGNEKVSSLTAGWSALYTGTWDSGELWDGSLSWDTAYWAVTNNADGSVTISSNGSLAGSATHSKTFSPVEASRMYRLSGVYSSSEDLPTGLSIRVLLKPGSTNVMYPDGRTADANGYITLTPTSGEQRRFLIDFICPEYSGDFTLTLQLTGSGAGSVTFHTLSFKRIHRFVFYEPRLPANTSLETESAATSIAFGDKTTGVSSIALINGDGFLEPVFGSLEVMRKPFSMKVGGVFGDGQDVFADDFWPAWYAYATDPVCDDSLFKFPLKDARNFLKIKLPLRAKSINENEDLNPSDDGKPRQMLFGIKAPMEPARLDATSNGYGIFEVCDVVNAPNGIKAVVGGAATSEKQSPELVTAGILINCDHGSGCGAGYPASGPGAGNWLVNTTGGCEFGDGGGPSPAGDAKICSYMDNDVTPSAQSYHQKQNYIPEDAVIKRVRVRVQAGQNDLSFFSVAATGANMVPFRPYMRYGPWGAGGGNEIYGTTFSGPFSLGIFSWYESIFYLNPDGVPWTRDNIFDSGGQFMLVGIHAMPASDADGYFTDIEDVRVVVDYTDPTGLETSTQVMCFTIKEHADKQPVTNGDLSLPAHYNLGNNSPSQFDVMNEATPDSQITVNLATANVTLAKPAKVVIASSADVGLLVHYTTERGTKSVNLPGVSCWSLHRFAREVQNAFNVADNDVTVVFNDTSKKFVVSKPSGTLSILCKTGNEPHRQPWGLMGFDTQANLTGSLTYTASRELYTRSGTKDEIDQFPVRCVAWGYKDDEDGTYTGTPEAAIEKGPDIAYVLLHRWLGVPLHLIDVDSFVAGRETVAGSRALTVHLSAFEEARSILAKIEQSCLADIVISGDGRVTWVPYSADVPSDIRDFYDRDYITFSLSKKEKNIYKGVRILYGADHRATGYDSVELTDKSVAVKNGRDDVKDIITYVRTTDDASAIAAQYFPVLTQNPYVVEFSARSKLIDLNIGSKIRLTRTRAMTATGTLDAVVFRVTRLAHNLGTGVTRCECVQDIPFL